MEVNWDPILIQIGPLAIRWYGFFMAVSMAAGLYVLVRDGTRRGYDEEFLYNISALIIVGGIVGARLVYVLTNPGDYFVPGRYGEIIRVDHGGLSLHGALLGGGLAGWWYIRRRLEGPAWPHFQRLLDLAVPGIAIGYMLVRIGNVFNHEVLGNYTTALPFPRHPVQLYASAAGLVLLLIHNRLARRRPPAGYLFWTFLYYYQWWRIAVEETVRDAPIAWPVYANPAYGIEIFTVTQVTTWPLLVVAWWLRRRSLAAGIDPAWRPGPEAGPDAAEPEEPAFAADEPPALAPDEPAPSRDGGSPEAASPEEDGDRAQRTEEAATGDRRGGAPSEPGRPDLAPPGSGA
ncbi:MAG TPA: prolipoprotein diacylglyceryl transferase family protein [Thermaerobacter sp.]